MRRILKKVAVFFLGVIMRVGMICCSMIFKSVQLFDEYEDDNYEDEKEKLKITAVENSMQESLPINDFQLSVQSLNDPDCYWLDSGSFEINIKAKHLIEY